MPSDKGDAKNLKQDPARARVAAARIADAARMAFKAGNLDEARKLVEDALGLIVDSPRLHIFQAKTLAAMGRDAEAKVAAKNAYDWVKRKPERYNDYRAYLEKELADYPQVKEAFFERGQEHDRQRAEKSVAKARDLRARGDVSAAMKLYLEALATRFQDGPALTGIEKILIETSNERGLKYLESFRAGQLSRKDLITLVTPDENAAHAHAEAAELDHEHGNEKTLADLVADIERELENDEKLAGGEGGVGDAVPPPDFQKYRKRAEPLLKNDSPSRIDLAVGYFEMGLLDVACEELRAIAEADELFLKARCLLGEFLLKSDEPLLALQSFQECLRDPRLTEEQEKTARYHLAKTYIRLGDWARAQTEIEALERRDPNYRDLRFMKNEVSDALSEPSKADSKKT